MNRGRQGLGQAGGRRGQGHRIGGHKKSDWQRDRGGSANPSSFQPVNSRKTNRTHQKQKSGFLDVKGCQTVEDLLQLAAGHGALTPSGLSAFWSRFPHLLDLKGHAGKRERPELKGQLESILATTVKAIDRFGARDVSTTALGMAKVVSRLQSNRNDRIGARSTLFQQLLVKCDVKATSNTFQLLANRARSLSNLDAQGLSNMAYAYALVEYQPTFKGGRTLFDQIASLASDRLLAFNSQNLANMVWSYAKVKASHPRLFEQVASTVLERDLAAFNAQELSNIVWAFAKAGEPSHNLFEAVGDHLVTRDLSAFEPQNLANIVWAFATAHEASRNLFEAVRDHLVRTDLSTFKPQALSNILWAIATAGEANHSLFKKVGEYLVGADLAAFNPQNLSNIVWAFATAGEASRNLFKKVGDHLLETEMAAFDPQHLANIVWAYSKANEAHPRLYKMIADSIAARKLEMFKPQELSNIVWAFATSGTHHPKLFDKVTGAAIAKRNEFNAQDVATTLWAFAAIGRAPEGLFTSFAPVTTKLIEDCSAQGLSNIAWAFAVANIAAPDLFGERFIDTVCEKEDAFNSEALSQLHQWNLWQQELGSHTLLPEALQVRCRDAFVSDTILTSSLQTGVVRELSAMSLNPKEEVLLPSGYRLDALAEVRGQSVGIEVDGPTHFIARKPTGSTLLKRRQVASIDGVQIVSVPYWEWDRLGKNSATKQEYFARKLGMN